MDLHTFRGQQETAEITTLTLPHHQCPLYSETSQYWTFSAKIIKIIYETWNDYSGQGV